MSIRSAGNGEPTCIYGVIDAEYVQKHTGAHGEGQGGWSTSTHPNHPKSYLTPQNDLPKSGTWGGHRPNNVDEVDRKRRTIGISGTGLSTTPSDDRLMITNEVYEGGSPIRGHGFLTPMQGEGHAPPVPALPPQDSISDDVYLDPVQTSPDIPQPHMISNPAFYTDLDSRRISGLRPYQPLDAKSQISGNQGDYRHYY